MAENPENITSPQIGKSFVQTSKGRMGVDTTNQFSLVSEFKGYRNKEDITNLIPGIITLGSQNVLSTTGGRFGMRKGYSLCGDTGLSGNPVTSAYDWVSHLGDTKHVRHIQGDGKLQMYYKGTGGEIWGTTTFTAGQEKWLDIQSITGTTINFTGFWNTSETLSELLFVNGTANIYSWTGAVAKIASAGTSTLVISGDKTWGESGFLSNGSITKQLIIGSTAYTYTGGVSGTTLTGLSPSVAGIGSNYLAIQGVVTYANGGGTGQLALAYKNDLISTLDNQVWVGSNTRQDVYISKVNSYSDFNYTSPTRLVGEGALITLDGPPTAFIPQESTMYVSAGRDFWYQAKFTLSSDNTSEALSITPLKSIANQSARSQSLVSKTKNKVFFVSFDPIMDELGRVAENFALPDTNNLSDPILNDFNAYDFTNAQCYYHKYFMYVALPRENKVIIYNMAKGYWEAPQVLPVQRFSQIDGKLVGHSSQTNESYYMFTGYNDNGQPINSLVNFAYQNYGARYNTKYFNEFYVEGYIAGNTTLNLGITYEIDGKATTTEYAISGIDPDTVALKNLKASLGKESIGKNPIGSYDSEIASTGLPPKFRIIKTFPRSDFYEAQYSFNSYGLDYQWEVLAFGPLVTASMYGNNKIKK